MYLSNNVYAVKSNIVETANNNKLPVTYIVLQTIYSELVESSKRDALFKSDASEYISKLLDIYKNLLKNILNNDIDRYGSLLYVIKENIRSKRKASNLTNYILQDVINTIYSDYTISVNKYISINEDWTDTVFAYLTSKDDKVMLTKDKVFPAIKNAPLLDVQLPTKLALKEEEPLKLEEVNYKHELAILLDKLGVIETVRLLELMFKKIFIFDIDLG